MSNAGFVQTDSFLDRILERKVVEVAERQKFISFSELAAYVEQVNAYDPARDFAAALRGEKVALIAEVKKASPSKGVLIEDFDPVALGKTYAENGAAAISVLTDQSFFQGDLKYLFDVHGSVDVPVLAKEFIISAYQVYGCRAASADAVLLIAAALTDVQLADLHQLIESLRMTALVEVHTEEELARALKIGAKVIGINNRDLRTFEVDLKVTERLLPHVPDHVVLVAESGLSSAEDVKRMGDLGANAVLIGESLVRSPDIAAAVREFSSHPHQPRMQKG
jgi:indole-3-glycerol phosphate synthase